MEIINLIILFFAYIIPMYLANATPIVIHGKKPLDFGFKLKGKRILGDGKTIVGTEEKDETLLDAINVLIANKKPEDMPRGLDNFRTMSRLSKAFEKADNSGILELEEVDYKFIKDDLEKNVPSAWGMNQNIMKAVESFLDAKSEE